MAPSVMALKPKKILPNQLQRGYRICTNRKLKDDLPGIVAGYLHHGIVAEVLKDLNIVLVIHFVNLERENIVYCTHHPLCTKRGSRRAVRVICLACFQNGHSLYHYRYNQGFTAVMRTTCSASSCDDLDVIANRAWDTYHVQDNGIWSLLNNCEDFADKCCTNKCHNFGSKQLKRAVIVGAYILS